MGKPRLAIFLTDADAGQGSTAKIIGGFAVGESDDFVLKVLLHRRSKTNAKLGVSVGKVGSLNEGSSPLQLQNIVRYFS